MTGLGETCSHVAAGLFYIKTLIRLQEAKPTCTQEKCQWIIPSYLKTVEYLSSIYIDFTLAQWKKET